MPMCYRYFKTVCLFLIINNDCVEFSLWVAFVENLIYAFIFKWSYFYGAFFYILKPLFDLTLNLIILLMHTLSDAFSQ